TRIEVCELLGGVIAHASAAVRGPLEGVVVMDDDDTVFGEMDVELETVGPDRHPVIERGNGVLGAQCRTATVRVHERSADETRLRYWRQGLDLSPFLFPANRRIAGFRINRCKMPICPPRSVVLLRLLNFDPSSRRAAYGVVQSRPRFAKI